MCLAIPGRVTELLPEVDGLPGAVVEFGGVGRHVCTACVPGVRAGEYVLVHAGLAISIVDEEEAHRLLKHLQEMGETDEIPG